MPAGVPPGLVDAILVRLRAAGGPLRRRVLLAELERSGHRVSLAGLNRALEHAGQQGLTVSDDEGVRLGPKAVRAA